MNPRKEDPDSAVSRAFIVKVASVLCTICVAVFAWGFKTMDAKLHAIGRRGFGKEESHRVAVEDETRARPQPADI